MLHRIFVYGTLKRRGTNHQFLAGQHYVGEARTVPGYCLHELDGYPGMVPEATDRDGVTGELWDVDDGCMGILDAFEGVPEGLYRRELVPLAEPPSQPSAEAYLYARNIAGRPRLGPTWPV